MREPTERELLVLRVVLELDSRKEAACALGMAPNAVKWHLSQLYDALGVTSRVEAARALGWLALPVGD